MRQRCTLCCQIFVPFILVLFVGIMQVMFNVLVKDQQGGYKYPDLKPMERLDLPVSYFMAANSGGQSSLGYLNSNGTKAGNNILLSLIFCFSPSFVISTCSRFLGSLSAVALHDK